MALFSRENQLVQTLYEEKKTRKKRERELII
jgi:hypothetical protein